MKKDQALIAAVVILALALIGVGIWGFGQRNKNQQLSQENMDYSGEVSQLQILRDSLFQEVTTLESNYQNLSSENESLSGSLADTQKELSQKIQALNAAKSNSAKQANALRAEIQQLLSVKAELENSITRLQTENDSLKTRTGVLEQDLTLAEADKAALANLNRTMNDEVKKLTLANFKASAFQVELLQKNAKATAKSGRARQIQVNFDMTNVPEEYQGVRAIYLAITDERGTPIGGSSIAEKVVVNGQSMDLLAVAAKEVNLGANQRLSFTHDLEDKLQTGFYRVAVYTDIGLLGSANFRLQ